MREPQTKTIDGHEYTVVTLPAMKGMRMFNRLMRIVAPSIAKVTGMAEAKSLGDVDLTELGGALEDLFSRLTEAEMTSITEGLLRDLSMVDGRPLWPEFDAHFQGRLTVLMQVLWFAMQVNFSDFFSMANALPARRGKEK